MQAQLLMIVHHRNLVPLIGYCDGGQIRALIYEYMTNGNLQHFLGNLYFIRSVNNHNRFTTSRLSTLKVSRRRIFFHQLNRQNISREYKPR